MTRTHFTLLKIWIFVLAFTGCAHGGMYPPPTLPVEPRPSCEQNGVIIEGFAPESTQCGLARRKVQMFFKYVAPNVPEIDTSRLNGFIISLADPSKQTATFYSDFWKKQVGGETWCQFKRIKVANLFESIPHELTHGGEGCPKKPGEPDLELALHPDWDKRGIYPLIHDADNN